MTQLTFTTQNSPRWEETRRLLGSLEKSPRSPLALQLPSLYRQLCADYALAQHRLYSESLCSDLNALMIRCRNLLTREEGSATSRFARLFTTDFPATARREWRLLALSALLFFGPMAGMVAAARFDPRWIFSVLGPDEMEMMDGMYGRGEETREFLRETFGSDFAMFGHYIWNNVTIALRMAGSGVLAMVGALFMLAYQGVVIGAMQGYVHYAGDTEKFYAFVSGHAAFELGGIVICGTAGLILGRAVLKPGTLSRPAALAAAGQRALPLIYGGSFLVFFAAFIEGFWSASPAPPTTKYINGIANWCHLAAYLAFAGRTRTATPSP
ncbi:MAG: stage II sporulation protein M [Verrucomicrobiota bacterium]